MRATPNFRAISVTASVLMLSTLAACVAPMQTRDAAYPAQYPAPHLATTSLDVLCETLGCTADFGPAYEPDDRPFIERFFGTLTTTLSRRLPGAVPLRSRQDQAKALARLQGKKDSLRLMVTAQELQELLEVAIWNYHGTPHAGLGGLTPLEMMSRHVLGIKRPAVRLRLLPAPLRQQPALLHDPVMCQVRGQAARGEKPHITYMHVRYTSVQLARSRPSRAIV